MIARESENTDDPLKQRPAEFSVAVIIILIFGWSTLSLLAVFLLNNFLTFWLGWPGAFNSNASGLYSWVQISLYAAALLGVITYTLTSGSLSLRTEYEKISTINIFFIRAAFWAVLLIGVTDMFLSILRGEEWLTSIAGETFGRLMTRADFRGPFVHMPLIAIAIVLAARTRTIGVTWLALLIVLAELLIVMFRFVFSYEQVFMADLVRFWYAPLFLFGCAYTLREDAHVRVDVFYANFSKKTKGAVNALGTLLLGMPFCWLILIVGLRGKTGAINSALLSFEIEGLGDGMYVLYLMTVFMGIFAVSMLIEFVGLLFKAVADIQENPGGLSQIAPAVH